MNRHVFQELTDELPLALRVPYLQGRKARENGRRIESCRLDNLAQSSAWKCGWHDADISSDKRVYKVRRVRDGE